MKYNLIGNIDVEIEPFESSIGQVLSIGEFVNNIITTAFIDYDGFARFLIYKDKVKYEITDVSYSINDNIVYVNKEEFMDLLDFCTTFKIFKVVWYNK